MRKSILVCIVGAALGALAAMHVGAMAEHEQYIIRPPTADEAAIPLPGVDGGNRKVVVIENPNADLLLIHLDSYMPQQGGDAPSGGLTLASKDRVIYVGGMTRWMAMEATGPGVLLVESFLGDHASMSVSNSSIEMHAQPPTPAVVFLANRVVAGHPTDVMSIVVVTSDDGDGPATEPSAGAPSGGAPGKGASTVFLLSVMRWTPGPSGNGPSALPTGNQSSALHST